LPKPLGNASDWKLLEESVRTIAWREQRQAAVSHAGRCALNEGLTNLYPQGYS